MFLGAGAVMHAMNDEVNVRGFGGLSRHMKITFVTFLAGYLAIIGFPFLSGYFSKDKIIEVAFTGEGIQPWIFGTITVLVAGLTAFYMSRVFFAIFLGKERWDHQDKHPHDPSPLMWIPMAILALGSLGLGAVLNYTGFLTWLEPAIGHGEHAQPVLPIWAITVATLGIVAVGVGLAWKMYVASDVPLLAPESNAFVRAARMDLYQDAFNENVFMKPGILVTEGTAIADQTIIDGGVEGLGTVTQNSGKLVGKLQTGYVRTYASWITVGVVLALALAVQASM